jgi:hypothetical protein
MFLYVYIVLYVFNIVYSIYSVFIIYSIYYTIVRVYGPRGTGEGYALHPEAPILSTDYSHVVHRDHKVILMLYITPLPCFKKL